MSRSGVLLLVVFGSGFVGAELTRSAGRLQHADEGNFSEPESVHHPGEPLRGAMFNLRVQVNDRLSQQPLSQAVVDLFVNYSKNSTVWSDGGGGAMLLAPYSTGLPLSVVASKRGYVSALLPVTVDKIPVYLSMTMLLLPLNQGNIWLYEDSVLITGRGDAASSRPVVRLPQHALNMTYSRNVSSIRAYLTIPKLTSEQVPGITSGKAGFVSVDLRPLAEVSVQLSSGDTELQVFGPIQISLAVPQSCGLQAADVVPAWLFNLTAGGWVRKGLGQIKRLHGKLTWTFTAPHFGHWMAAPLSPPKGFLGLPSVSDFIAAHSLLLLVVSGGLLAAVCVLIGLLCHCRWKSSLEKHRKTSAVMKTDRTTSTCPEDPFEVPSACRPSDGPDRSEEQTDGSFMSVNIADVISNPGAVVLSLDLNDVASAQPSASLANGFFFYNPPVAVLQREEPSKRRSATLPRTDPQKPPCPAQTRAGDTQDDLGGSAGPVDTSEGPFGLPESASVPGTLLRISQSRHSMPSPRPPRAWFVSLEGKPAAEIRYATSEQQRRRRTAESRDTSLDSGVDMSELGQASGRRTVTLERKSTFTKSSAGNRDSPGE